MKRKKWSEAEERTLLTKYSQLLASGALAKLKTRQRKFQPIADHLNAVHHGRDPLGFPHPWSWRDVSVKVQNMRHQYLGVKHKIRAPDDPLSFSWADAPNHWDNFMMYRDVFGDVELEPPEKGRKGGLDCSFDDSDGFDCDFDDNEEDRFRKARREGEKGGEPDSAESSQCRCEERSVAWARRESERRARLEAELDRERRARMRLEERREEEEMEWRERMLGLQLDHEKQMMQMHAEACHNQMQVLGVVTRLVCHFFGSAANDGLGAGLGSLPPQVLHNLQHPSGLGDSDKPDSNSPSEFM